MRQVYGAGVRPEHIFDPKNRDAFVFAVDAWTSDGLGDHVVGKETLEETFGVDFSIPHGREPLATSIDAIKDRFRRQQTGAIVREASMLMAEGKHDSVLPYLVDEASAASWRLQDRSSFATTDDLPRLRDIYNRTLESSTGDRFGAPFGFPELDDRIGGIRPGELCVVAGYSGVGKSNFLGWSAIAAQRAGFNVMFVTLEMAVNDILMRLDAYDSGLAMGLVANPAPDRCLTEEQLVILHESQEARAQLPHSIKVLQPRVGERSIANIVAKAREHDIDYLIIDQLSHVEDRVGTNFRERRDRHADRVMELKGLISDSAHPIPCMLAVQFNRASQENKSRSGDQHNIADSADVERTADIALGLSRSEGDRINQLMKLKEMKVRRDSAKNWELDWRFSPFTRFAVRNEITEV